MINVLLQAKEIYQARCLDYERLKRDNATPREIEKVRYIYICHANSNCW